ncbi:MAG: hypothetical protein RBQ97_09460 [Acholeplasma sp.]|jgi:hypothetical protein|nr:hypothetical protein [Acholeplasma sp.]
MGAIVIKADKESKKMLPELARKLGGSIISIDDKQFEDFAPGTAMDKVKTGEWSDRDEIMKKLSQKLSYSLIIGRDKKKEIIKLILDVRTEGKLVDAKMGMQTAILSNVVYLILRCWA